MTNNSDKKIGKLRKGAVINKPVALHAMSKYSSRKEWETACWQNILKSESLLQLLVTSHERHTLVMRAATLEGIAAGKTYRKIGEELWLSPQTVSGVKKAVNEKSYRSYLERSKTERKKRKYDSVLSAPARRPRGRPLRTKYGVIRMPY